MMNVFLVLHKYDEASVVPCKWRPLHVENSNAAWKAARRSVSRSGSSMQPAYDTLKSETLLWNRGKGSQEGGVRE
jgi:hypothetical protein